MTEQNKNTQQPNPMKKGMQTQLMYMLMFIVYIIVLSNGTLRAAIGHGLDYVFSPVIGFGGSIPVITLLLAGLIIGIVTSIPRYIFTDWVRMGRAQNRMKAFNKVMREAWRSNDKDRIQKLRKMQLNVSMEQQEVSMNTMKPLMVFSVVTYMIFIWLFSFISGLSYSVVAFPWNWNVNLLDHLYAYVYYWIIIYFLAVLVVSHVATMSIKYVDFKRKLRNWDANIGNETDN